MLFRSDDADYDDELENHADPVMIHPHELPDDDEHVANELQNEFDVPDDVRDEIPGHYEPHDIVDQLLEEIDNDTNNEHTLYDLTGYDDTPVNNQDLLDGHQPAFDPASPAKAAAVWLISG